MRMTIAVTTNFSAIHFNKIYPGRDNLSDGFHKILRDKVETYFALKLNKENKWVKNNGLIHDCDRVYNEYGYGEYSPYNVWVLKEFSDGSPVDLGYFLIYNESITCPCGCGSAYTGSDVSEDEWYYNGWGHINENWSEQDPEEEEETYCEEMDDYTDCDGDCQNCELWNRNHAHCEITDEVCDQDIETDEFENEDMIHPWRDNIIHCDARLCAECPHFREHYPDAAAPQENN